MKTLVAYYSRSGHTEQVAKEIAARCQADIDRVRDDGVGRSGLGGACAAAEALPDALNHLSHRVS
jgi:flavodoxin